MVQPIRNSCLKASSEEVTHRHIQKILRKVHPTKPRKWKWFKGRNIH
jgi:hypothetical protein